MVPPQTPFGTPHTPIFGSNQNVPFIFNQNVTPRTANAPPWQPPPFFSPDKAFPNPPPPEEPNDIDMSEPSPNKGDEQLKSESGRAVAVGALRRVYNARKKTRSFQAARRQREVAEEHEDGDVFDSDEDVDAALVRNTSNHYTLNLPAAPPVQSDLPYILLGSSSPSSTTSDIAYRNTQREIAICSLQYKTNLCGTNSVPAMAQQCANWETCMNRDPAIVGRAKVGAELIAEVVNGFVEPISWKALAFTLTSLSFLTVFINSLLSLFRARQHHPAPSAPTQPIPLQPQQSFPGAPTFSGGYLSPAPTPSWGRTASRSRLGFSPEDDEDLQTPTRRRRLDGGASVKVK
ncbi:hypothetical protein D9615_006430 [Tricholomella constricta]|uniref:Brl1/Brr6 domain-containing protein n=1 Tax=Tricholomella constricta TaxID=117010 RepID=A0A8H5H5R7_9AGAR|nr:hypothetical protein D9615_006430 [Tricholomella constricta]